MRSEKNVSVRLRRTYALLLENAYGNSLTNKQMWMDVFAKLGKVSAEEKTFDRTERDFGAVTQAEDYLEAAGYSIGSMQSDNPRALVKGKLRIAKWWNIDREEYHRIDGLMLSDDYRTGSVLVVLFKASDELGEVDDADAGETPAEEQPPAEDEGGEGQVTPPPAEETEKRIAAQPQPGKQQLKMPESIRRRMGERPILEHGKGSRKAKGGGR